MKRAGDTSTRACPWGASVRCGVLRGEHFFAALQGDAQGLLVAGSGYDRRSIGLVAGLPDLDVLGPGLQFESSPRRTDGGAVDPDHRVIGLDGECDLAHLRNQLEVQDLLASGGHEGFFGERLVAGQRGFDPQAPTGRDDAIEGCGAGELTVDQDGRSGRFAGETQGGVRRLQDHRRQSLVLACPYLHLSALGLEARLADLDLVAAFEDLGGRRGSPGGLAVDSQIGALGSALEGENGPGRIEGDGDFGLGAEPLDLDRLDPVEVALGGDPQLVSPGGQLNSAGPGGARDAIDLDLAVGGLGGQP